MSPSPLPVTTHQVALGGQPIAHLFRKGDYTWLEWQDGYWDDPRRPVLGLRFEDDPAARVSAALRLPPWFSNLLPEGALREWVARDAGVSPDREMMLLERMGTDLPGAVSVNRVSGRVAPAWDPDGAPTAAPSSPQRESRPLRFSLAGVALKFSMLQRGDRLTLPAHGQDGDWIVKMPDAVYESVPHNEFAMMTMAAHCGIDVPQIRLHHRDDLPDLPDSAWPSGQPWAYAVKRFDRVPDGRVHIEDLAQVRGFYPQEKYAGSFATVAALVYRRQDLASYLEFVRRLFFSYAIGNGDMHLKNVSLIYRNPRRPVISPAYDLVSTAPYRNDQEDLGLKLGRSKRFDAVSPTSFEALARDVRAPVDLTMAAIADVAGGLPYAWSQVRQELSMLPGHVRYLDERLPQIVSLFR